MDIRDDYFITFLDNDVELAAFKGKNNVKPLRNGIKNYLKHSYVFIYFCHFTARN